MRMYRLILWLIAGIISISTLAVPAKAQSIVGPEERAYPERRSPRSESNPFARDWLVLEHDVFFGGAKVVFGFAPPHLARRSLIASEPRETRISSGDGAAATNSRYESMSSFGFGPGGHTVSGAWIASAATTPVPDAPLAASDTFTWNNSGTDFNTAASWTNTGDLSNGVPNFNNIADFSVSPLLNTQPDLSATRAVRGITFGVAADGFVLSSSNNAQLAIGVDGIQASNLSGTNSITAPLVLNMTESITQASGGTLNLTGPVVLGGDPGISLTIGNTSNNGTINFSPSSVELAGDLTLVTNVNVTLPAINLLPAPAFTAGLTKEGSATLTLTAGGSYNGLTTVNAGTLVVTNPSGSATGTGGVLVNNSGTLGGTGRIDSGANTITINGTLSPGANPAAGNPGTINLASSAGAGALTLGSSSNLLFDINTSTKDLIALTDTGVSLGGGTLTLNLGAGFDYSGSYAIFTGVSGLTGSFGMVNGYDVANYSPLFTLNGTEYDLTFTLVPEPATWIGGALALGGICFASRRRRLAK